MPDSSSCGLFAIAVTIAITQSNLLQLGMGKFKDAGNILGSLWKKNNVNIIGYVDIGEVNNQLIKFEHNLHLMQQYQQHQCKPQFRGVLNSSEHFLSKFFLCCK